MANSTARTALINFVEWSHMPRLHLATLLLGAVLLSGCAGWAKHGIDLIPPRKLKVAVLPVSETVKIRKLDYVKTIPAGVPAPADEAAAVEEELSAVRRDITSSLEAKLPDNYLFEVIPDSAVMAGLRELGFCVSVCQPDAAQAARLGKLLGADAVLSSKLSGYGRVKNKWITLLIASGVIEGGVQGYIAARLVRNTWVGVAVAAEEVAQEVVTWWGGAYLFGKAFSPVIIEGELRSSADGSVIWSKTAFATLDKKKLLEYPEILRGYKELRLRLTAQRAVDELVRSLRARALKNVH